MNKFLLLIFLNSWLYLDVTAQDTNPYRNLKFNNVGEESEKTRDYGQFAEVFKQILLASPDYKGLVGEIYAKGKYDVPMHKVKLQVDLASEQFIVNEGYDGEIEYSYFLVVHENNDSTAIETEKQLVAAIEANMLASGWGKPYKGEAPPFKGEYSTMWKKGALNFVLIYHYKKENQWVVELEILRP